MNSFFQISQVLFSGKFIQENHNFSDILKPMHHRILSQNFFFEIKIDSFWHEMAEKISLKRSKNFERSW